MDPLQAGQLGSSGLIHPPQGAEPALLDTQVSSASSAAPHTLDAPSFAAPLEVKRLEPLRPGDSLGDFRLLRELGKGGFATVFLAQQISLGRKVALKIGPNRGSEAQTLARLEHDHIVHVFSESIDQARQIRLLCMQYVAGTTLQEVLRALPEDIHERGTGRDFLAALDRINQHEEEFRPIALQEREVLAAGDFYQAVCWIGSRLAHALEFAHQNGVLHRDIKPANILLNAYGRPFLADFNLATSCFLAQEGTIGGTLPYMAPEHLRAFSSKQLDDLLEVDQRSDLYSLGVVLFEFATGQKPYAAETLLDDPRPPIASLTSLQPTMPLCLDQVICKCLAVAPDERFQTATELYEALENCRRQIQALQQLPPRPAGTAFLHHRPFLAMLILSLVPNLIGSGVNVAYNFIHIVNHLSPVQKTVFHIVVLGYNVFAYPILVGITCYLLRQAHRDWMRIQRREPLDTDFLNRFQKRLSFLSTWSILGPCFGWLPGGIIFPLVIHFGAEPLSWDTFIHFFISFFLSGLIAVTYCYLGTQYVVLRVLSPKLAGPFILCTRNSEAMAQRQTLRRLALFQVLSGVIPLVGALLMIVSGPAVYGDFGFRLLLAALIVLGMIGFTLAMQITRYLTQVLAIMSSTLPAR
jgi:serine/threonine protein kinase